MRVSSRSSGEKREIMDKFVAHLLRREEKAVTQVMAFMSYNPAIGRVFEPGGVKKFQRLAQKLVTELHSVTSVDSFDHLHHNYVKTILNNYRTSRGKRPSYGQGQKAINVFLKVYVDWAGKPNKRVRRNILPYLHVPLDSYLMEEIRWKYKDWYEETIRPFLTNRAQPYSLSKMNRKMYIKWQEFFRKRHPKKPLIFDIAWAISRHEAE